MNGISKVGGSSPEKRVQPAGKPEGVGDNPGEKGSDSEGKKNPKRVAVRTKKAVAKATRPGETGGNVDVIV